MKLLIVDDEVQIRMGLAKACPWESYGFSEVLLAENGVQALEFCRRHQPEVVITDIRMPGLDGIALSQQVTALYHPVKIIVLSGHSEFGYAQAALKIGVADYLLKPVNVDELEEKVSLCLQEIQKERKSEQAFLSYTKQQNQIYFLKVLGTGARLQQQEVNRLSQYSEFSPSDSCFIACVSVDCFSQKAQADQILEQYIERLSVYQVSHLFDDAQGAVLLCPGFFLERIEARLQAWQQELNHALSTQCNASASIVMGEVGFLADASTSYLQSIALLRHRLYRGAGCFLSAHEMQDTVGFEGFLPVDRARITDNILHCRETLVYNEIQEHFQAYRQSKLIATEPLRTFCLWISNTIYSAMDTLHIPYDAYQLDRPTYFLLEQYEQWCVEKCNLFFETATQNKAKSGSRESQQIADYIAKHFREDIALETVAESVGKSKNYFSSLFKKEMEVSFVEYLNQVRIDEACRLLDTTDDLTYEICEQVGFRDYKYFHRVFKKHTGISPTQYRKR